MREYREDREKMMRRGRDPKQIDLKIVALKKNIDRLKKKGED